MPDSFQTQKWKMWGWTCDLFFTKSNQNHRLTPEKDYKLLHQNVMISEDKWEWKTQDRFLESKQNKIND